MKQLSGRVYQQNSDQGLSGVPVSNGEHITHSGEDGVYHLDVDETAHNFVWITEPTGYRAEGDFFRRSAALNATADFPLVPDPIREKDPFQLAQITDTHVVLETDKLSNKDVLIQSLQQLVLEASPDLIIVSGDLTNLGTIDELIHFKEAVENIDVPVFPLFGGHDGNEERFAGEAGTTFVRHYEEVLGPTYFSFDWGSRHFVLYPNEEVFFSPADQQRKRQWLWADLASQPEGRPITVVVHAPPPVDFLEALGAHNVSAVLHGHWHSSKAFRYGDIRVMATPPLCFGGIDTTARGYRLLDFAGAEMQCRLGALYSDRAVAAAPAESAVGKLVWQRQTNVGHRATPLYGQGKLVLSAADEGLGERAGLQCLDADSGAVLWDISTHASVKNGAVCAGEEGLAAISVSGRLYRVDWRGRVLWEVDLPEFPVRWVHMAPAVADGVVYAGAKQGYGAYDLETGRALWYSELEDHEYWPCYASPQVYGHLLIVLVPRRGLLALDCRSGSVAWEQPLGVEYQYGKTSLSGDLLISGGDQGHLAVLRAQSGQLLWNLPVLHGAAYPSGLAADGERIFATTPAGEVRCHDLHSGELRWKFHSGADLLDLTPYRRGIASILAAPVLCGDRVLVGANDGVLYTLEAASGQCVGRDVFAAPITTAPALLEDGLCVATWDGQLYRFSW